MFLLFFIYCVFYYIRVSCLFFTSKKILDKCIYYVVIILSIKYAYISCWVLVVLDKMRTTFLIRWEFMLSSLLLYPEKSGFFIYEIWNEFICGSKLKITCFSEMLRIYDWLVTDTYYSNLFALKLFISSFEAVTLLGCLFSPLLIWMQISFWILNFSSQNLLYMFLIICQ